ncbi:MAG: AcrB/AcrD/AcrF family protein [Acidobacteria bacterium]|nr:MAG: AcrB/AcrD/AcrF family protein [Acidobacteriota bacterium]
MTQSSPSPGAGGSGSVFDGLVAGTVAACLKNKLVVGLGVLAVIVWGAAVAPFDWQLGGLPRNPVATDAIPDIGENQQIVFTRWMGRSPQDVEDQITYPLTVSLLGLPQVKTIRSYSMFGFSTILIIFEDDVEFYWSRSRILEKLNSLPTGTLPAEVQPSLGPDATSLGQIFWYTLEGADSEGRPTGGWDLHELRTIQDWYVRYSLMSVPGVSEVASIGGFVQEYQIDVDPDAMRAHGVKLQQVFQAVQRSNIDVGARSIEINRVEYVIRGLGFIESLEDIQYSVIRMTDNVPLYIKDVAEVHLGPAGRRGALDKGGAETVGGVVVVRYGENPLATINSLKEKIAEIAPGLPRKTLDDGTLSQVRIVPFYDRSGLIYETLGTLSGALIDEIFVTMIVILLMVMHLRSSLLISAMLPLSVLMTFIAMKIFGVEANLVALSGIAIAIGSMVTMGIFLCENILRHLEKAGPEADTSAVVYQASTEVGSAVLTALLTTVISFLPVFTMQAAEGKLFKPLAFTKTFAMIASLVVALAMLPPAAHVLFTARIRLRATRQFLLGALGLAGLVAALLLEWWIGAILIAAAAVGFLYERIPDGARSHFTSGLNVLTALVVSLFLTRHWLPLGVDRGFARNFLFVVLIIGSMLLLIEWYKRSFPSLLRWCLRRKAPFLVGSLGVFLVGMMVWRGSDAFLGWLPDMVSESRLVGAVSRTFPGLGEEFMPPLDEGSFLYMPALMPHASIGEALDVLQKQNRAVAAIPEVETVAGKLGRVDSALDPAPIAMLETIINYLPEYRTDKDGRRLRFAFDTEQQEFLRDENGELIPDRRGRPFRQWRDHIRRPDDIWDEIVHVSEMPGVTTAPKLQPINARIVMLQSGMRAPMGVKVKGPSLEAIEKVGLEIERYLKEVPSVEAGAVVADRIIGKPYLEIDIDRRAIARHGVDVRSVQHVIEVAIGGMGVTTTVEGRERFPVRVRYLRELRDQVESLEQILVPAADGAQVPLRQLANIEFVRGPQNIKSEDTFLVGYVVFDMKPGYAEVDVVEQCQSYLSQKIESGEFVLPAGVSYAFAGSYENQIRSAKRLAIVLPIALVAIFFVLYFQFKSVSTTLIVFSTIAVAWSGGFLMLWLYAQPWFLDFSAFGVGMRELFQMQSINLSVAIWVGFLALFGIASDNGVVVASNLEQVFRTRRPGTVEEIRQATLDGAQGRLRATLMSSAATMLALLPVLTSSGRGADIMVPMAIPSFGGMVLALVTVLMVPVLYCSAAEIRLRWQDVRGDSGSAALGGKDEIDDQDEEERP